MLYKILLKTNKISILLTLFSMVLYAIFAYSITRTDYLKLIILYAILFFLFYKLIINNKNNFYYLAIIALVFRLIFLLAIPNLSQDFYRFIWDGRMILNGFNPYLYTPESFISKGSFPVNQAQELYLGMKPLNASHFTNYPPINQLCFSLASLFANTSIVGSAAVLRLLIIAADLGTLYFGKKLLKKLNVPINTIFLYVLNPFIIIELTGNLHFESVMIFFLIWSLYLLHVGQWRWSAMLIACSISTKLVPLIFLPLFIRWFIPTINPSKIFKEYLPHLKKLITFYTIIGVFVFLMFLPFFSLEFISNYSKTVGLWFGNFEFNASLYYIAREIGYLFRGWNEIAIISKILPVFVFLFVLYLALFKKNPSIKTLAPHLLMAFTFYLFMSTTIHPWYIATLLIISLFTNYKFPLIWSGVIVLSYMAYANSNNSENLWIIGLEYLAVYGYFIWEVFIKKNPQINSKNKLTP